MKRSTTIGAAVAALALLYAAGPLWAGWQLRQAVKARDLAVLEARVDWPQLRANLKPRLAAAIRENADRSGTVGGMVKRAVGATLTGAAVDTMVTPANLARLLAGRAFLIERTGGSPKPERGKDPQPADAEDPDDPAPARRLRWAFFDSPTRFRIEAVHPRLPNSRIVSILALEGWAWKLVDVEIAKR